MDITRANELPVNACSSVLHLRGDLMLAVGKNGANYGLKISTLHKTSKILFVQHVCRHSEQLRDTIVSKTSSQTFL